MAAQVTFEDGTIMRPLAFDFPADPNVYDIRDQYMFGPGLMVCPVTESMYYGPGSCEMNDTQKTRPVHLPAGTDWIDFWTGTVHRGGITISANATIDAMPLFVRAGTLLPMAEPSFRWRSRHRTRETSERILLTFRYIQARMVGSPYTRMKGTAIGMKRVYTQPLNFPGRRRQGN